MPESLAELLNRSCCRQTLDKSRLHIPASQTAAYDNLFAAVPIFVSEAQRNEMALIVEAINTVAQTSWYRHKVLSWAPAIAQKPTPSHGVFMGYDFHVTETECKIIEINTNAGGGLLNVALLHAQQSCCDGVRLSADATHFANDILAMFREEWRLHRGNTPLQRIAIVDDKPTEQFLYPEFLLFAEFFKQQGIDAVIADPAELTLQGDTLLYQQQPVNLVYNRLTDFALESAACQALREAYLSDRVVVTPHPRAHALYADKRNLTLLCDAQGMAAAGVDSHTIEILSRGIPRTELVTAERADEFWATRNRWFFKPFAGYGSRAVYRGDKITKRVFGEIIQGGYLAQQTVPPGERCVSAGEQNLSLKVDWRNYVYHGKVQLLSARLYQGQTTNFRTPGGGFAAVYLTTDKQPACIS